MSKVSSSIPLMRVFFDTEFTELGIDPRLISIGLVAEDGERTFYAELSDTYEDRQCSDFVRKAVLPHLEGGVARIPMNRLTLRLGKWLESLDAPVKLVTDSLSWDWPWIQEIFQQEETWPANVDGKPEILDRSPAFDLAVEKAFTTGLRRHHSLDDAKANRLAWLATQP
ncbi:3'-5' exoribonuclease domain-containing protein [Azospira sp. I09]|uniref:3'-5' exoribonuclease domain-containing protein n=1 Tax=Azospira sp. I09 TaxID=1765049 RepID=UPI0012608953|nr:3'-5' exoribonuclease [Azospira sp. I09]BBN89716.1 hypothetical protein AZSP09_27390 [Azospira sp. I09]